MNTGIVLLSGFLFLGRVAVAVDDEWAFLKAVQMNKVPPAEILARFRMMVAPGAAPVFFDDIFSAACVRADRAQLDEYAKLAAALPDKDPRYPACFSSLSAAFIRQSITRLAAEPPSPPTFPAVSLPPPEQLEGSPAEILEAWRLYQSVVAPYRQLAKSAATKQSPPGGDAAAADRALRKLLAAPEPEAWRQLFQCDWRSWCGTGSQILYHPRNRGILLSLLADGRLAEAAGASLGLTPGMFSSSDEEPLGPTIASLLTALGLDWESVYLGSILPDRASHFGWTGETKRVVFNTHEGEHDAWSTLAARGSDRGLRLCLSLIRRFDPAPYGTLDFLATALGPEPARPGSITTSNRPILKRHESVSPAVRRELLEVFASYLAPSRPASELDAALRDVPFWLGAELHAPLRVLAAHPAHAIASKARSLLSETGGKSDLPPLPPPPAPLARRLLANGRPLGGVEVEVSALPGRRSLGRKLITRDDGVLQISIAELPDARTLKQIEVSSRPANPYTKHIGADPASKEPTPHEAIEKTPYFSITASAFAGESGIQDLHVRLAPLEVRIDAADKTATGHRAVVSLRHFASSDAISAEYPGASLDVLVGGMARFESLQCGTYEVGVEAEGCVSFEGRRIAVNEGGLVMPITLIRGIDIAGTLVFPNGKRRGIDPVTKLYRDGAEHFVHWRADGAEGRWHGLPPGQYRAVLLPPENVAPEDRHGRLEFEFELTDDSPAAVDLGEIAIPRAD